METLESKACCAHTKVKSVQTQHEGGTMSEHWECVDCRTRFKPDFQPVQSATQFRIQCCRKHWQQLAPHCKDRDTAKHLISAIEIAERLERENEKLIQHFALCNSAKILTLQDEISAITKERDELTRPWLSKQLVAMTKERDKWYDLAVMEGEPGHEHTWKAEAELRYAAVDAAKRLTPNDLADLPTPGQRRNDH